MLTVLILATPVVLAHLLMRWLGVYEGMHTPDFHHFCPCSVTPC